MIRFICPILYLLVNNTISVLFSLHWCTFYSASCLKLLYFYVPGPPWLRTIVPWSVRLCGRLTNLSRSPLRQNQPPQSSRSIVVTESFFFDQSDLAVDWSKSGGTELRPGPVQTLATVNVRCDRRTSNDIKF